MIEKRYCEIGNPKREYEYETYSNEVKVAIRKMVFAREEHRVHDYDVAELGTQLWDSKFLDRQGNSMK